MDAGIWCAIQVVVVSLFIAVVVLTSGDYRHQMVGLAKWQGGVPYPSAVEGTTSSAAVPAPRLHFVQYQGPPALERTKSGRWRHHTSMFCQALLTAAVHGVDVTIIGLPEGMWGQAWPMYSCKATRVWGIQRYVAKVPDGDIVFFFDAMDTLVLHGVHHILRSAAPLLVNNSVVFSGERNCYPWGGHCHVLPASPTTYRFVNAGGMVGRAGPNLRNFLEAWRRCTIDGFDDQLCANWLYADFPPARRFRDQLLSIKVDHHSVLFQSAWGSRLEGGPTDSRYREVERGDWIREGRLVNPETSTTPSLLHFNGYKGFMDYYFAMLFPNVTWDHPRVRDRHFTVWGHRVRGADFCRSVPAARK
eukprot:GGOE01023646.1.p1 GENE.GGOE01023646.1~~GGOE01023646.1.p1  ORF type:complete len:360 (-),score=73.65 GGOE01023646.1:444-1523(-)